MCNAISKIVLVIVNTVFALLSLVVLGLGIWAAVLGGRIVSEKTYGPNDSKVDILTDSLEVMSVAIVFIVVGCFGLFISICGCFGAMKESTCMLKAYTVTLFILLVIQIVAIGVAAAYMSKIEDRLLNSLLAAEKKDFIPFNQINSTGNATEQDAVSRFLNAFHITLQCCGVNNYTDITVNSSWSAAKPKFKGNSMLIPASCCKFTDEGVNYLTKNTDLKDFDKYLVSGSQCPTKLTDFHDKGCLSVVADKFKGVVTVIIIAAAVYIASLVVLIGIGCFLLISFKDNERRG